VHHQGPERFGRSILMQPVALARAVAVPGGQRAVASASSFRRALHGAPSGPALISETRTTSPVPYPTLATSWKTGTQETIVVTCIAERALKSAAATAASPAEDSAGWGLRQVQQQEKATPSA